MNHLHIYASLLVFLLTGMKVSCMHGASPFKPGYYINQEGDTIKGLIKFQIRDEFEIQCIYKAESKAASVQLFPLDIIEYGFDKGKIFISRSVIDTSGIERKVFLELLQTGRLKLLRHQDRFFLEYGEGTFKELISTVVSSNIGYRVFKENKNEYVDVLVEAMNDCPRMVQYIESRKGSLELKEAALMKLVRNYHNCFDEVVVQPDVRPVRRLRFGSLVGGGQTSLNYNTRPPFDTFDPDVNTVIYSVLNTEYTVSRSPMFGMFANISFPRSPYGISFQVEFLFKPLIFTGQNAFPVPLSNFNEPHDVSDEIEVRLNKIIIPIGIRKTFGQGNSPVYLGIGFSLHLNAGRNYTVWRESQFLTGPERPSVERLWPQNPFEPGIWALAGVVLAKSPTNQLSLEIRAEQSGAESRLNSFGRGTSQRSRYLLRSISANLAYSFSSTDSANK